MPPYSSMLTDDEQVQPPDPQSLVQPAPPDKMASMAPASSPAPPSSIMGDAVPPGQPIPEQEMHHARMKNLDDRAASVSSGIIGLDWHDPDYTKKLAALHAQQGALHSERSHEERTNPWGSMGNHPGIMGKIGHGLAVAGNIAGNALAPTVMPSVPGSQANLAAQDQSGQQEVAQAGKESLEASQASAIDNAPGKAPTPDQQVLDAGKRIAMGQGTPEDMAIVKSFHDLTMSKQKAITPGQEGTPEQQLIAAKQALRDAKTPEEQQAAQATIQDIESLLSGKQKPDSLDQQYDAAVASGDTKTAERLLGEMQNMGKAKQPPQRPPQTMVVLPGGQVEVAKPGSQLPVGTQNMSGFSSLNRPTNQTRSMSEMADSVLKQTPKIISEVDAISQKIGPGTGRWNEFWVNKAGIDDPDFAGLDTDLDLYASALVRTHFGSRGGQQYREALRKQFSEAQSPEDLKSRIEHAEGWIRGYSEAGKVPGSAGAAPSTTSSGKTVSLAAARQLPANRGKSDDEIRRDIESHGHKVSD